MEKKIVTIPEFIAILKTAKIEPNFGIGESAEPVETTGDEGEIFYVYSTWGHVFNSLTLNGLQVDYQNSYQHPTGKPSEAETSTDVQDLWIVNQNDFKIVDEDGDEVTKSDLFEIMEKHTEITKLDLDILGDDEKEDVDVVEGKKTVVVSRDNAPDIRFTMEWMVEKSSSPDQAHPDYSGSVGRWYELTLYKTVGGKYICHKIGHTQWQGEKTRYTAEICETIEQVIKFFGHGDLAKELYEIAEIDTAETVE